MIYLGLRDLKRIDEAVRYKIESVRFPKERIEMYARHQFSGPDDVALVRTRERVFFIPGKIMPVGFPGENCSLSFISYFLLSGLLGENP